MSSPAHGPDRPRRARPRITAPVTALLAALVIAALGAGCTAIQTELSCRLELESAGTLVRVEEIGLRWPRFAAESARVVALAGPDTAAIGVLLGRTDIWGCSSRGSLRLDYRPRHPELPSSLPLVVGLSRIPGQDRLQGCGSIVLRPGTDAPPPPTPRSGRSPTPDIRHPERARWVLRYRCPVDADSRP